MRNRILFATDVPFWLASTGAEQRILAMHRFLSAQGSDCGVFFLGDLADADKELITRHGITVFDSSSQQPPEKLLNRLAWYADATVNQARSWLFRSAGKGAADDGPPSLELADFQWNWAVTRFGEVFDSFKPNVIMIEYIKMAYLLKGLSASQRQQTALLIDTHDVLHRRAEQFFANGFPHWLKIDRDEEAAVLQQFDAVIAIQDQEAQTFRSMVGDRSKVITVGHAVGGVAVDQAALANQPPAKKITVGYIGSKNFSNWQAIREFLNCAWPTVLREHQERCDLVIAGGICDWLGLEGATDSAQKHIEPCEQSDETNRFDATSLANVRLLGRIDDILEFYEQIDLVINPVQFGTGLKIKNAESLRFGKLLITTTNGFDGMPEATRLACMVVESVNEMGSAINSICNDLSSIRRMQKLALQLSQTEFSEKQAYRELDEFLAQSASI